MALQDIEYSTNFTVFFYFLINFYAFNVRGQWRADRKALGGARGVGLVKDLEEGIELRSHRW